MNDMGEAVKSKLLEYILVLFLYFIGCAFYKLLLIEKYVQIPNHAVFSGHVIYYSVWTKTDPYMLSIF